MRNIFVLMLLLSMTTVPLLGMNSEKNHGLLNCVKDFYKGYCSTMNENNSIFDDQDTNSQRFGKALAETILYFYYQGGVGVIDEDKDVPKFLRPKSPGGRKHGSS